MSSSIKRILGYLITLTTAISNHAIATSNDKLSFAGFAAQGAVYSSDNTFFDEDKSLSTNMTEVALQSNYLLSQNLRFSGQAMYRHWGKSENLLLDYFMVDYQIALKPSHTIGFRLGRIKSDLGLVNATRDIPQARPSIFLPQSVYQDIFRETTSSYDGISVYGNFPFSYGRMSWSIAYGTYPESDDLNDNILDQAFLAKLTPEPNIQVMATWESPSANWLFSFGFDNPNAILDGNKQAPQLRISDSKISYDRYLSSLQYFSKNWDFTVEHIRQVNKTAGFGISALGPDGHFHQAFADEYKTYSNEGYYGQLRYLLNDKFTLLTRYERYYTDNNDKSGQAYYQITKAQNPKTTTLPFVRYHHDATIGLKWQITAQWILHSEAHFIQGTAAIAPILKVDERQDNTKSWQLLTAQLSYSF